MFWVFCRVLFWRMETSVLCSLNFTISLPSLWEEGDTAWEVNPNSLYQKAWVYMMATEQGWSETCSTRRPKAGWAPELQEAEVHVGAELGGPAAWVGCWAGVYVGLEFGSFVIWIFPKVRGRRAGCWDAHRLRAMLLGLPSPCLHLLPKASGACSSPCPTLPQRLQKEKTSLIFLTLMKACINKGKHFLHEEQESWKMESLGLFFLLIVSWIKMVHAGNRVYISLKAYQHWKKPRKQGFSWYPSLLYSSWWERKIVFKR